MRECCSGLQVAININWEVKLQHSKYRIMMIKIPTREDFLALDSTLNKADQENMVNHEQSRQHIYTVS
jgi:hypothetical protein